MGLTKATYNMISQAPVNVRDFGATGDGVTDDSTAIQSAIDYAETINQPSGGYGSTIVYFPSGVYLCKTALTFAPFINYKGVISTIANAGTPYSTLTGSAGTIIRAHADIYNGSAPSGSNFKDGVLVHVPNGDCYIEGITFVGTATINSNPNVGVRLGTPVGSTSTCQGISLKDIRFVACKIGMEWNSVLIESGIRVYWESCTTCILSNPRQTFNTLTVGNEAYLTNCWFGAYSIGVYHMNDCLDHFSFENTVWKPNDSISVGVSGEFTAITNINYQLNNCNFQTAFDNSTALASLAIGSFTTSSNPTKLAITGCEFNNPISINNPDTGSQNYKNITFTGCVFNCETINITAVNGVKFVGNDFIDTVLTFTNAAKRGVVIGNHFEMTTNAVPVVLNNGCALTKIIGNSVSDVVTTQWPTFSGTASNGCTVIGNDQNSGANYDNQRFATSDNASVPSNFAANRTIKFEDVNGVPYYVAASSATW